MQNIDPISSHSVQPDMSNNMDEHLYAAIDLGSNSFHVVKSRYSRGEFIVVDRHKETVRLAAGLDDQGHLNPEAHQRAMTTLGQFSQLLRDVPKENVRAVGTNAMRRMKNSHAFIDAAEQELGTNIEIVAGREEARLIYLGVVKGGGISPTSSERVSRLVIDIGGGSTEIIVGEGDTPKHRESLEAGCVVLTQRFFSEGVLSQELFDQAILEAKLAVQPVARLFKSRGWQYVLGCSGTIKALSKVLIEQGWSQGDITKASLDKLLTSTIECGSIKNLDLAGLSNERKPVFAGGLSVLIAVFEVLGIDRMEVSDQALREGVLYDLIGRSTKNDVRGVAVNAMLDRFGVDTRHATFVQATANRLYKEVASSWGIDSIIFEKVLNWAALLHEIGMLISHDGYQKHGAYLLKNADMVGFSRREQSLLSSLIKGHRGKFPLNDFECLNAATVTPAKRLAVILRLAVLLHRTRSIVIPSDLSIYIKGSQLTLDFPNGWLADHPLTLGDLQKEKKRLSAIGVELLY